MELPAIVSPKQIPIFLIPKSKQRHVNVYGFNEKNTWSENISRQMSLPERKEFKKWLKSHGFNLD